MDSKKRFLVLLMTTAAAFGAIAVDLSLEGEAGSSAGPLGLTTEQPLESPRSGPATGAGGSAARVRTMRKSRASSEVLRQPPLACPRRI